MLEGLSSFARIIVENNKAFSESFPKTATAAEAVHQGINTLLYTCVRTDPNNIASGTAIIMGHLAHGSWINAYNLTASGYVDSGFCIIRKAIEFVCYAAKVHDNKKRAEAWIKQHSDPNLRKQFALSCSIPMCYVKEKYAFLRPLLVEYDTTSYFGVHGNFESLAHRFSGIKDNTSKFTYLSDSSAIPVSAYYILYLGYQILKSLNIILKKTIYDEKILLKTISYIDSSIKVLMSI